MATKNCTFFAQNLKMSHRHNKTSNNFIIQIIIYTVLVDLWICSLTSQVWIFFENTHQFVGFSLRFITKTAVGYGLRPRWSFRFYITEKRPYKLLGFFNRDSILARKWADPWVNQHSNSNNSVIKLGYFEQNLLIISQRASFWHFKTYRYRWNPTEPVSMWKLSVNAFTSRSASKINIRQ